MNITIAILVTTSILVSGCASVRPQSRIIDATNSGPVFQRQVETKTYESKPATERRGATSEQKRVTYDFTY